MATVFLTNESKAFGVGTEGCDGDSMAKRSERVLLIPLLRVFFPSTRILFSHRPELLIHSQEEEMNDFLLTQF